MSQSAIDQIIADVDLLGQVSYLIGFMRAAELKGRGLDAEQCADVTTRLREIRRQMETQVGRPEAIDNQLGRCCHDERHDGAGDEAGTTGATHAGSCGREPQL